MRPYVTFKDDTRLEPYQISFIWQSEDSGIFRLSNNIGHSVGTMLNELADGSLSTEDKKLVSSILSLPEGSQIAQYRRDEVEVTLIIRKYGSYNSMYMIIPGYQGLLHFAGPFSSDQAKDLISWIDVDSLTAIATR